MKLFIHALGASSGGGLTYLRNVIPHLAARLDLEASVLVGEHAASELAGTSNVQILKGPEGGGWRRSYWEQREIPNLVRKQGADVLLAAGNFALWNSPVPQILLSRNSLYTSTDFERDLRRRGEWRMWADTRIKATLARKSIVRAELTLAPSAAFAGRPDRSCGHADWAP